MYATPDDKMITRMLPLPSEKNKNLHETDAQTVCTCMAEYKIDNRTIIDILDQICKDADLIQDVNQHKFKRDGRRAFMPSAQGSWAQTMSM